MTAPTHAVVVMDFEEGFRPKAYYDTKGFPTIGSGFLLCRLNAPLAHYANFSMSRKVSHLMLSELSEEYVQQAEAKLAAAWNQMNEDRRAIVVSMIHQLGISGVLGFGQFLKAAAAGNWREAYNQMLDSKWAKRDTPERAQRHALVMYHGSIPQVYNGVLKL